MRQYLVYGFEALTIILGISLFVSVFLFTSKGLVSRKTLLFAYGCFVLFMLSMWITAVLTEPSIALGTLVCSFGIVILVGIAFAVKYYSLPHFNRYIEKKSRELEKKQ